MTIKTAVGLLGVLAMAGCVSRAPVPPVDTRVTIAPGLGDDVQVIDVRAVRNAAGFMTMQANVVNDTDRPRPVDWKTVWLDGEGVEIDTLLSTWDGLMLNPMEIRGLKSTAPNPAAADFRLYLRRPVK